MTTEEPTEDAHPQPEPQPITDTLQRVAGAMQAAGCAANTKLLNSTVALGIYRGSCEAQVYIKDNAVDSVTVISGTAAFVKQLAACL